MGNTSRKFDPEFINAILYAYESGKSVWSITQDHKIHHTQVKRVLRENNIEPEVRRNRRENHGFWKGGRTFSDGYVLVYAREDDEIAQVMALSNGYVPEHRLVMAHYLERPLLRTETVHHIDGDKMNNDISNLQLRIGNHGNGQAYCCEDCGSTRLKPILLN